MYHPILRGKRHELKAIRELASLPVANKCKPLLEPVNLALRDLAATIGDLYSKGMVPFVIVNPGLGDFRGRQANILQDLQTAPESKGKFVPCVKIMNSFDTAAASVLQATPGAAAYLVSDASHNMIPMLNSASCTFVNPLRVDNAILSMLGNVIVYTDCFGKQRRNADYPDISFYSSLHNNYRAYPNAVGFGDYTVLSEEYSEAGGPAYVVAIHMPFIEKSSPNTMYVKHFCSTILSTSPSNPEDKFHEALAQFMTFDAANPGLFDRTWGMSEFQARSAARHYPGLGVVKELSVEHHMETICNFI
ncbi:hypothetical protein CXF92_18280 [Pseudomonas sp. Choline-3u-10]|mgnify:CR=1 FL=1|jgi:hypothetical protein|uniref:sce7725 family protein n=1 Tax=Pseudomonadaceae TaxID=135621 RepID=UPI000617BD51|nr:MULTISPECIES: sce7725 family protein [Pseudomonadaceae]MAL37234.1 hypothetical protein [Pseudomonas sp.]MBU0949452.1 sce7725 family protein [Gammaproteobacteria bacterium]KJJ63637.1 hypothetical protein RT21_10010 [Pseudomonas sp. 10B238]MBK3794537.1 sce7725 family protein [Stutzerimonas stutzeri]MBK3879110.1 sce7725 family protein [Stutzerimonas stutzeri]|tara:strand:- start:8895 stop:9809 length:915 start_codon:yes stop_codon:yes gene_type:complete